MLDHGLGSLDGQLDGQGGTSIYALETFKVSKKNHYARLFLELLQLNSSPLNISLQPSVKLAGRIWRTSGPSELLPPRAWRTCGSMRRACAYQHDIPTGFTLKSTAAYRSNPNFDVDFIFKMWKTVH
jgi:hypothetical protein